MLSSAISRGMTSDVRGFEPLSEDREVSSTMLPTSMSSAALTRKGNQSTYSMGAESTKRPAHLIPIAAKYNMGKIASPLAPAGTPFSAEGPASDDADTALVAAGEKGGEAVVYQTHWSRIYVLILYSLFCFFQSCFWAMPGPAADALQAVYGFPPSTVQLLIAYGAIFLDLSAVPYIFVFENSRKGVKYCIFTGIMLVGTGCILRALATPGLPSATPLLHISFILNALAGPVAAGLPAHLSQTFFSPSERTAATAVMAQSNVMVFSQLLVPYVLTQTDQAHFTTLSYIGLGMTVPLMVAALFYLPGAPPSPPSASAAASAHTGEIASSSSSSFWTSLGNYGRDPQFWIIAVSYALAHGSYLSWAPLLSISVERLGYSPLTIGWMAFAGNIAGVIGGVVAGHVADSRGIHKQLCIALLVVSSAIVFLFSLGATGVLPSAWITSSAGGTSFFILAVAAGLTINSTLGLFLDSAAAHFFPAPEASTITLMTAMMYASSLAYLVVPVDSVGTDWMHWLLCATLLASAVGMTFYKPKNSRAEFDRAMAGDAFQTKGEAEAATAALMLAVASKLNAPLPRILNAVSGDALLIAAHNLERVLRDEGSVATADLLRSESGALQQVAWSRGVSHQWSESIQRGLRYDATGSKMPLHGTSYYVSPSAAPLPPVTAASTSSLGTIGGMGPAAGGGGRGRSGAPLGQGLSVSQGLHSNRGASTMGLHGAGGGLHHQVSVASSVGGLGGTVNRQVSVASSVGRGAGEVRAALPVAGTVAQSVGAVSPKMAAGPPSSTSGSSAGGAALHSTPSISAVASSASVSSLQPPISSAPPSPLPGSGAGANGAT